MSCSEDIAKRLTAEPLGRAPARACAADDLLRISKASLGDVNLPGSFTITACSKQAALQEFVNREVISCREPLGRLSVRKLQTPEPAPDNGSASPATAVSTSMAHTIAAGAFSVGTLNCHGRTLLKIASATPVARSAPSVQGVREMWPTRKTVKPSSPNPPIAAHTTRAKTGKRLGQQSGDPAAEAPGGHHHQQIGSDGVQCDQPHWLVARLVKEILGSA